MNDIGISKNAPEMAKNIPETVIKILEGLKKLGVLNLSSLKDITIEDLMNDLDLPRTVAKKLYQAWQNG